MMTFNIWDNIFAGYMSDPDGGVALFNRKVDADRAIQHFVGTLSRRNDWLLRHWTSRIWRPIFATSSRATFDPMVLRFFIHACFP
jgi:hypothetical protein